MVTVALALPVLILFASFVIDVGNWFVHQRHLQLQADAGALAAAGDIRYPVCEEAAVKKTANQYSGTEGGIYNAQVGGTLPDDVLFALNSANYPDQPSKLDPNPIEGSPCQSGTIDVKLAEENLPFFFKVASALGNVVPFINAHARVQVFRKERITGALPVAVPDPNPQKMRVEFYDEANPKEVLGSGKLSPNPAESSGKLAIWDDRNEPLSLKVGLGNERIGMKVALSGGSSTACEEPLVECHDGILFVRGYSMAGSGAQPGAPLARSAYLEAGTCADPYFSAGGCAVVVHVDVDFGPCGGVETNVGARLTAVVSGKKYAMKWNGLCTSGGASEWATSGSIPIPAEAGPAPVELEWEETKGTEAGKTCKATGGNPCKGSFGIVQRSFASNEELSGPIRLAQIEDEKGLGANSFERCSAVQFICTYGVVVRIGIDKNLLENAKSPEEPPVHLRLEVGNQNQSLDCEEQSSLKYELANGCTPEYAINQGNDCPAHETELWASPQPWECVAVQPGSANGQIYPGMNERVFDDEKPSGCTDPSHWPDYETGDPRIVPVFITPFGAFNGTGNNTVPVTDFATFYVTGWAGGGNGAPKQTSRSICDGSNGETPDDETEAGSIVGHFIRYVQTYNDGSAGETVCDEENFEDFLTPCVAVMVE